jgi:hypothetical protein
LGRALASGEASGLADTEGENGAFDGDGAVEALSAAVKMWTWPVRPWRSALRRAGRGVSLSSPRQSWTAGFWFWQGSSVGTWSGEPVDVVFVHVGDIQHYFSVFFAFFRMSFLAWVF